MPAAGVLAGTIAMAAGVAGEDAAVPAVEALMRAWPGVYDTAEETVFDAEAAFSGWPQETGKRVRTVVAPVRLPWLGERVLYLEEFLHGEAEELRRQVLLRLEPEAGSRTAVRVRSFTFREPARWRDLHRSPFLREKLRREDLEQIPGCDLVLRREGDQFRGGTVGRGCIDSSAEKLRYVDYQLVLGKDLYWYRKRLLRVEDDELEREVAAFDWFELNEARLFTCRVRKPGRDESAPPIATLDVHDQGGRARFTAPDGRSLEIELHSTDWPYGDDRDALILLVQEPGGQAPLASSWAEVDASWIALDVGWLRVDCGEVAAPSEALRS